MRKHITVILAAAVASLALLVPISSAQALTRHTAGFCGSYGSSGLQPMTLRPGQACTFWPVSVSEAVAFWTLTSGPRMQGGICVGVVAYPPGWPRTTTALDPRNAQPDNYWNCQPPGALDGNGIYGGLSYFRAANAFGVINGQAVLLNFSNSTIRTQPNRGWVTYYL